MWTGTVCVRAGAADSFPILGPTVTVGRARESAGSVFAVVASRRCPFPPISLHRCSSSAARRALPLRIRMRAVAGSADGFAAVVRAAASSRPLTGRPRVAALSVLPAAVFPGARAPWFVARPVELTH